MTGSSDIAKLFKSFGGNAAQEYREIVDHDRQDASRTRWPMLEQIPLQAPMARKLDQQPKKAEISAAGNTVPLPSFHSLRVLAPSTGVASDVSTNDVPGAVQHSSVPEAMPQRGTLQDVFRRIGREPEESTVEKAMEPLSGQDAGPSKGIASIFQRLRRS